MSQFIIHNMGNPVCPQNIKIANIQVKLPVNDILDQNLQLQDVQKTKEHEEKVMEYISQSLRAQCNLIVLPELSTSPAIEKQTIHLLQHHEGNVIVVCGSYFYNGYNRAPVLMKLNGKLMPSVYQEKFFASANPLEQKILKPGRSRHLFINTGLGDLAVFICYEANDWTIFQRMEKLVDMLVVVAYNKAIGTFCHYFRRACYEHFFGIVYCNDAAYGESSIFLPLKNAKQRQLAIIPKNRERVEIYTCDIERLEAARKRDFDNLASTDIEFASPPNNVLQAKGRYSEKKRSEAYFKETINRLDTSLLPLGVKARVDHLENDRIICDNCQTEIQFFKVILTTPIEHREFKIGREYSNHLIFKGNRVISSEHATISYRDGNFIFKDHSKYHSQVGETLLNNTEAKLLPSCYIVLAPEKKTTRVYLRFRWLEIGEAEPTESTLSVTATCSQSSTPCPQCKHPVEIQKLATIWNYKKHI